MNMITQDNFERTWRAWGAREDNSLEFTITCEHDSPILLDTLNILNKWDKSKGENTIMPIYYGTRNSDYGIFAITEKAIKKVIFNPPATIILWSDGMKTVVKCREGDTFDRQTGFAMAVLKKIYGKKYHHVLRKYASEEVEDIKEVI